MIQQLQPSQFHPACHPTKRQKLRLLQLLLSVVVVAVLQQLLLLQQQPVHIVVAAASTSTATTTASAFQTNAATRRTARTLTSFLLLQKNQLVLQQQQQPYIYIRRTNNYNNNDQSRNCRLQRSRSDSRSSNRNKWSLLCLTPREEEIQRKIIQLKRQQQQQQPKSDNDDNAVIGQQNVVKSNNNQPPTNKNKKDEDDSYYASKLQAKLGSRKTRYLKSKLMGETNSPILANLNDNDDNDDLDVMEELDDYDEEEDDIVGDELALADTAIMPTLGSRSPSFSNINNDEEVLTPLRTSSSLSSDSAAATGAASTTSSTSSKTKRTIINPDLFDDDDAATTSTTTNKLSEKDLVELVEQKLKEKRLRDSTSMEQQQQSATTNALASSSSSSSTSSSTSSSSSSSQPMITSGVGGNWDPNQSTPARDDLYVPSSSGSWGAFPRPRDISKAYGGGRQIKPGSSSDSSENNAEDATRERLRQYRERVGIEVPSERDHAQEINEALVLASYAMQRGVYATAVSALEKVTKYCSTNSKVGGKVFLELAMAYEAVGQSGQAMTVYRTLSTCRIEEIKFNAKRLLYGMEAMQFMREEAKSVDFSRKKIRNTFIDTTGLANIAQQFDDVYQTAYIDLNSNFYRRLTESVVRSHREARQILLKAASAGGAAAADGGGVDRLKIVQALRSLARNFESALEQEMKTNQPQPEPVALMNGMPIVPDRMYENSGRDDLTNVMNSMDEFVLASAAQMMENLQGEWRLQLIADRRGDGVKYFNTTSSWQTVDTTDMTFQSSGNVGFLTMTQSGNLEFDAMRRVLKRKATSKDGGGNPLANLLFATSKDGGVMGAIYQPQQIMSVDSILLVTQCAAPTTSSKRKDNADKDHFAVWKRVETGTYSKL